MTTIVLADDHHVVRQALKTLLEVESDFFVIGEVADGLEVADLVERLKPDLGSSKKINRRNIKQIKEEYGRNIFPGSAIAPSVVRVQP